MPPADTLLTATALEETLNLPSRKVNSVLAELGWISKDGTGWVATPQALALGAKQKRAAQSGVPFVVWPPTSAQTNEGPRTAAGERNAGSMLAEVLRHDLPHTHLRRMFHSLPYARAAWIEPFPWLYMSGIVHAYERRLPIEEEAYCDFYLPAGKVYIEYWGIEHDRTYATRKQAKQALYRRYQFNLIELTDDHIRNLDDALPKLLLKYGVVVS
jgi:hypothetical protein